MGILNYHYKKKWINRLQYSPYNLTLEKANEVMYEVEQETLAKFKKGIEQLKTKQQTLSTTQAEQSSVS